MIRKRITLTAAAGLSLSNITDLGIRPTPEYLHFWTLFPLISRAHLLKGCSSQEAQRKRDILEPGFEYKSASYFLTIYKLKMKKSKIAFLLPKMAAKVF